MAWAESDTPLSGDPESTRDLIARAQSGDEVAMARLYERHLTPLRRWASGRLPNWARGMADTDDVVQETLLHTLRRIAGFEPRRQGALHAYLRQAVMNRIRDEVRKKIRHPTGELPTDAVHQLESPLDQVIGHEAVERYERALDGLQPAERDAIIGRIELGYTYQELADALGKPSAEAARKAAERALIRLAEEMRRRRE